MQFINPASGTQMRILTGCFRRQLNKKARRGSSKNHIKGPRKRTNDDDERFARSFEKLMLMAQAKEGEQNGTV